MKPTIDKQFRCATCQRGFTRIDHLKRHQLRHTGLKPYSCVFCSTAFARCDNLRDHYSDCAKRGDQKIPETGQRGRRRHACQSCTLMKLRCDGENPCSSCRKRNIQCNGRQKPESATAGPIQEIRSLAVSDSSSAVGSASTKSEEYDQSLDRGSIKFLLNAGTDSFTERFHLPPRNDRFRGLVFHNQKNGLEDLPDAAPSYDVTADETTVMPAFIEWDPATLSFFQDTFISLFHGPFSDVPKSTENSYSDGAVYEALLPGLDPCLTLSGCQTAYEPEKPFSTALIQSILSRVWTVPLCAKAQTELTSDLNFLLTTSRIRRFVSFYFKYWHPNGPMIHPPSFNVDTAPLPLLAAVVFMGAIYSNDVRETSIAKKLLDFAELFVYSSAIFSYESEIGANFGGTTESFNENVNSWTQFQSIQAGFLMVIVQYWAGSRAARNRAMESRFSDLIKACRRIGLLDCRHQPQEPVSEELWIQTESRIRTISIISLMDCAFLFFQNFPCRVMHTEMKCEFPCDESVFNSPHPFSEPKFCYTRGVRLCDAFQYLFEERPKQEPSATHPISTDINPMKLTVLDMFVLIHLLYAFIDSHMTLLIPVVQDSHPGPPDPNRKRAGAIPEDATLAAIRNALSRWRDIWLALRSQVSCNEWVSMGFYKNGYNFWLVSQLLITNKCGVDVVMRMEVNCEDKLQRLNVLLQDENE